MFSRVIFPISAGVLSLGTAVVVFKRQRTYQRQRILQLEQQIAVARLHQELNEKKFAKLFEAVLELRTATEAELGRLRSELDRLLADRSAIPGLRLLGRTRADNAP